MQTEKTRWSCAAFILAFLVLFAPSANAVNWIASADVSWYDAGQTEFTISTEQQLAGLAKLVNDGNTFEDKTVRLDADLNLVEGDWTPIGVWVDSAGQMMFRGTFDGQGHLIHIKSPLFGNIGSVGGGNNVGTVLNVNLSGDVSLVFNSNGQQTVGVLAREACGTIRNCSFTGSISIEKTGEDSSVTLGGLIGRYGPSNKGTEELSDCRVRARMAVRGKDCNTEMGGIVATCGGTVRNCVFEGELSADIPPVLDPDYPCSLILGGIVAGGNVSIKDCRSRFSVSLGETRFYSLTMGGIKGEDYAGSVENCLAEWTISEDCRVDDESSIGGIAGRADRVTNCVFDGGLAVGNSSLIALGGIYGDYSAGTYNCFARGSLSGGGTIGGLAGKANGAIENSSAACKIVAGQGAVSGALVGNNAGAVKECRWVSGLGAERAVGNGAEPVSTDVAASESALPATSIAVVPLLDLTENRDTPVRAEVYPQTAANKGTVGFSWTTADKDVLNIASPNMETAVLKGLKEGTAGLKLSCGGLLGGTTYNPTSFVTVRRIRLESLNLSPGNIELSQKGQKAEIRAEIRPGADVASFPQCDWSFKVVEGASAEADDIELTPAANGLGATVALSRPVSGAKYRIVASAVDGSGLSDDVIVTVKYVSPVPTSPDVSPDIPAPLSPDVPAPVSPDIEVPEVPEKGVAPRLPDKAPAGVGSSKPEFFKGKETSALKSAADALSDSGLTEEDLTFDADTGVVRLQSRVVREVAGKVLPSGSTLRRVRTLPVLSAVLPQGANVAAVGLELTGAELLSKKASEVMLLKVTGPDTGVLLEWAGKPDDFGNGRFTVLDGSGQVVDELRPRSRYVLTVFIGDGGKYDLDGKANGKVVDPLALLSVTGGSEPGPSPQPEPEGRDSGGGCDAGFLWSWLLLLAAVPVVGRRRG